MIFWESLGLGVSVDKKGRPKNDEPPPFFFVFTPMIMRRMGGWPAWSGLWSGKIAGPRDNPTKRVFSETGEAISQGADETRVSGAGLCPLLMLLHRPCCACPTAGCKYDAHMGKGRAGQVNVLL